MGKTAKDQGSDCYYWRKAHATALGKATDPWTDQRQTRASLSRISTQVADSLVSNLNGLSWDQGSSWALWELTHYSSGRDPYLDGPVGLQTERPACTGQLDT